MEEIRWVAEFEKVSYEEYVRTWKKLYPTFQKDRESLIRLVYDNIKLPTISTIGSCGHDFYSPFGFTLRKGDSITIPTGIRCKMDPDYYLMIAPRSGQGTNYNLKISNTIGIIDKDYYDNAKNEGHIMVKIVFDGFSGDKHIAEDVTESRYLITYTKPELIDEFNISADEKFCQGIINKYFFAENPNTIVGIRNGGFGSTGK